MTKNSDYIRRLAEAGFSDVLMLSRETAETIREKWEGRLGGVDAFVESHCSAMIASLWVEYGNLGPFGLTGTWKE